MKILEYNFVDKSGWPQGEWNTEPDKRQWPDAETGLPCLAVRNQTVGSWCGYVGVTAQHPWYGREYDDDEVQNTPCHGGLTFAGPCMDHRGEHGICHIVEPGEDDKVWWFGFDCGHFDDVMPGLLATMAYGTYKNLNYIILGCHIMARFLQDVELKKI